MTETEHSREALVHRIACELDMPSLYMGGPSPPSKRKAERIVDMLPDYRGAVSRVTLLEAALLDACDGDEELAARYLQRAAPYSGGQ